MNVLPHDIHSSKHSPTNFLLIDLLTMSSSIPDRSKLERLTKAQLTELCGNAGVFLGADVTYTKSHLIEQLTEKRREMREAELVAHRAVRADMERRAQEALDRHRQTRSYVPRRQQGVKGFVACLEYPLSFLDDYGGVEGVQRDLVGCERVLVGPEFPNNVAEYLWIHAGENDEEPWKALGRLHDGTFVFYKAECDYTGFDCQGAMQLWAAGELRTLIDLAMDISDYDQWISETRES